MRRKLPASLLALVVCASLWPFATAQAQRRRRPVRRGAASSSSSSSSSRASAANRLYDARVAELGDAYLRGYYAFNPSEATSAGLHEFDSKLEERGAEAVAGEARRLRGVLAELARVPEWRLSPESRYDFLVLQSHARAQLLELEEIEMWRRDPNLYNRLVSSGVDNILKRAYAPIEPRLAAVLARERQIPRLLAEARVNLVNPPRLYTETAIAQVRGSVTFFENVVPQMFERAGGSGLNAARRAEFHEANEQAAAAVRSFSEWLERDLLPRSNGDFALGAENFRKKLLYEEMVETPLPTLLRDGERQLRETQDEMRVVAEEIAPGRGVEAALQLLAREHPAADGLVGEARADLDRIRAFVRSEEIMTPPARENLSVAETPEYARSLSFASLDAPGAFERVATEGFYYVTPADPTWTPQQQEEHLGHYNRYSLTITSIHEAYPGHYYQLLKAKQSPSRVRSALGSASFVEGWAHYCEQMMLDEGFGGNNPKLRLAQLDAALLRLCRYVVGLRLHTAGMSYEEAVSFFMREGYQARTNAEREARRGTLDPTYLVYTLGKMEILKLRDEWRKQLGDSFRIGDFHDRLLSYGMPPIKILRMAMLGEEGARVSAAAAQAAQAATEDDAKPVEFSLLATGAMSTREGVRAVELIADEAAWRRAWETIGAGRPLPDVSFDTRAVVIAYQGQQRTGGYSIEITGIKRIGTVLAVTVGERRPASGSLTTEVITSPYVAVSIPRPPSGATVRFADERGVEVTPQQERNKNVRPRARGARRRRGRR
ncbi:MAG: hypothetical protein QOE46_2124 [Acidobacteriota bacterium]|jgi:uncharacterized protein (DUF885 family)|nr:hypothetical protein [Acidobacteriota bacterium]